MNERNETGQAGEDGFGAGWLANRLGIARAEAAEWLNSGERPPHCLVDLQTVGELVSLQERVSRSVLVELAPGERELLSRAAEKRGLPLEAYVKNAALQLAPPRPRNDPAGMRGRLTERGGRFPLSGEKHFLPGVSFYAANGA
ncbi:MAG: hypothetical protein LIO63_07745 [Akkermansia sp.]|nr:hypothetical protein [Akkermansia sp.]